MSTSSSGSAYGSGPQHDGVEDAEDRRVGADPQRQRQHDGHAERGLLDQGAKGIAKVTQQSVHGESLAIGEMRECGHERGVAAAEFVDPTPRQPCGADRTPVPPSNGKRRSYRQRVGCRSHAHAGPGRAAGRSRAGSQPEPARARPGCTRRRCDRGGMSGSRGSSGFSGIHESGGAGPRDDAVQLPDLLGGDLAACGRDPVLPPCRTEVARGGFV